MKNFLESGINLQVSKTFTNRNYGWNDFATESCIKTLFEGAAIFLGKNKSKDTPTALVFKDIDGRFHFGAYVQFHKQEEEGTDEGSWTLSYTYNEDDIDPKWAIYDFTESQVAYKAIIDIAHDKFGINFKYAPKDDNNKICEGSAQELLITIMDVIFDYMRANVSIDPVLEFPGYFTMTSEISGNSVYVGIEPSEQMKQHVKDDSEIEVNE
jgi:hypothetical protein